MLNDDKRNAPVVAVIQARMGSQRLPGKILAEIAGLPLLELILRRVGSAQSVDKLIVATTRLAEDDVVEDLCCRVGVECYRGSVDDCLDRIYQAVTKYAPNFVVRLTGDNPVPNGEFVDWVVGELMSSDSKCDYVDTMSGGTFPYGLSVEVVSFDALSTAWTDATDLSDREHVTQFIRRRPEDFECKRLSWDRSEPHIRVTIDLPEDLEQMRRLFRRAGRWDVGWREIISLARRDAGAVQSDI